MRLQRIPEERKADPILIELQELIKNGWPETIQDLPQKLHSLWCLGWARYAGWACGERKQDTDSHSHVWRLSAAFTWRTSVDRDVNGGPVGRNWLRQWFQTLNLSFTLFFYIRSKTSMLRRGRRVIYWANIQDDIMNLTGRCTECQINSIQFQSIKFL